jgi:predicted nucleic acid-binding protein
VFLAKLDRLRALRMFNPVLTTLAVVREVEEGLPRGHPEILAVRKEVDAGWLKVRRISESPIPGLELDPGELTVLRLASRTKGSVAVVDDLSAIRAARRNGIQVLSTPFLLLESVGRGDLDPDAFRIALDQLLAEGYRLGPRLYVRLLDRAAEYEGR